MINRKGNIVSNDNNYLWKVAFGGLVGGLLGWTILYQWLGLLSPGVAVAATALLCGGVSWLSIVGHEIPAAFRESWSEYQDWQPNREFWRRFAKLWFCLLAGPLATIGAVVCLIVGFIAGFQALLNLHLLAGLFLLGFYPGILAASTGLLLTTQVAEEGGYRRGSTFIEDDDIRSILIQLSIPSLAVLAFYLLMDGLQRSTRWLVSQTIDFIHELPGRAGAGLQSALGFLVACFKVLRNTFILVHSDTSRMAFVDGTIGGGVGAAIVALTGIGWAPIVCAACAWCVGYVSVKRIKPRVDAGDLIVEW